MRKIHKTEARITSELAGLRQRVAELETLETEHKRLEEALQESREALRRIFESVTEGIPAINSNGIITEANRRTVETHGFNPQDELLGKGDHHNRLPRWR